jgi:hypothetical protein
VSKNKNWVKWEIIVCFGSFADVSWNRDTDSIENRFC